MYLPKFTKKIRRNKNYVGFIFGAIRKNDEWFYNDKALQ